MADFRLGAIRCLTNVNVLTTGFDVEHIDFVAMLRPTLSSGLYVQMLGRGTRKADGKANCLIADFSGNVRRHGPVDAVAIRGGTRHDEREGAVRPDSVRAKACPDCNTYAPIAALTCRECGYEWPRPAAPKHTAAPDIVPVMGGERVWLEVRHTIFRLYLKPGSQPTLQATHHVEGDDVREWIGFSSTTVSLAFRRRDGGAQWAAPSRYHVLSRTRSIGSTSSTASSRCEFIGKAIFGGLPRGAFVVKSPPLLPHLRPSSAGLSKPVRRARSAARTARSSSRAQTSMPRMSGVADCVRGGRWLPRDQMRQLEEAS